ncbi:MAG: glutamate dehydrogenase, partial [Verrucomicrobiota bacterium]
VGTNAQVMAWMADTYLNFAEVSNKVEAKAVVTGKPLAFGGSPGREKATGQGLVYVVEELLPEMNVDLPGATVSLLGYGNVGSWTGRLLQDRGAAITTVMDHTGAIRCKGGLDAHRLAEYVNEQGGVAGFPSGEAIDATTFYSTPVDLFIPAALEQMIQEEQAGLLDCKVLVEAANAPTTPRGEQILLERGIEILPAILCNAGGVTVSYFEWKQNRQSETWTAEEVDSELQKVMRASARRVKVMAARLNCSMRIASYAAALEYIDEIYELRGIFP